MPLDPGTRVGPYEIVAAIGAGGMGEVYKARDLQLGRSIALKVLLSSAVSTSSADRFEQEARAASALSHPNVCHIYALGVTPEGQSFIAMEYVQGGTLRKRLADRCLTVREAVDIAIQIAGALSAAHGVGVVHRDVKPDNVMVTPDGLVKVLDFGLAKMKAPFADGDAESTRTIVKTDVGIILGTVTYMSPEQARGDEADARTDIWSLGVLLYEMITGRNPFAAPSSSEVFAAILDREPAPIARFEPNAPIELQRIVGKTLRKDRDQRYQSMKDLLLDLQALRDTAATQTLTESIPVEPHPTKRQFASRNEAMTPRSPSSAEYVVAQIGRYKRGAALTAVVLALIVGGGSWIMSRKSSLPKDTSSVAVLPFKTIGEGDGYFADGITEAVTTELGRVGGLRVISSNTAFRYRDKTDSREIARELGVGLVVRGSVQRAGQTVRIDVSLINTVDETALWSDRYSKEVTDVLAVQDDISRQIASTLSKTFGAAAADDHDRRQLAFSDEQIGSTTVDFPLPFRAGVWAPPLTISSSDMIPSRANHMRDSYRSDGVHRTERRARANAGP